MKFVVAPQFFEKLPDVCFGVVVARNIDNAAVYPRIEAMLEEAVAAAAARYEGRKIKDEPAILPYRQAFQALELNPNKFMSSIEAMFTRVGKGKGLPRINPIVDLGNALSLRHALPMGAHDIGRMDGDIEVRFTREGDSFVPVGEAKAEPVPAGEPVYAVGRYIRTRRWIWRQSELGKIGPQSKDIFFPIDGFASANKEAIFAARRELADCCARIFGCRDVKIDFLDASRRETTL